MGESIPEPVLEDAGDVVEAQMRRAASYPDEAEAPESLPYSISFAQYKEKKCEMREMEKSNAAALLLVIRAVGMHYKAEHQPPPLERMEFKPVFNDGDYCELYRSLDQEEVKEIKYTHPSKNIDLRLFYFTVPSKRMFYIIAAKSAQHIDTDKGARATEIRKAQKRHDRRAKRW